jgi:Tfp pilus assembly protein PilF
MGNNIEAIADDYYNLGKYEKSLSIYQRILDNLMAKSKDSRKIAMIMNKIADTKCRLGFPRDGLKLHQQLLEILMKNDGEGSLDVAITYNCIGVAYHEEQALHFLMKSQEILLKNHSSEEELIAANYYDIAQVLKVKGEPQRALSYYQQAIEIARKHKKRGSKTLLASSLHGLGNIYIDLMNLNEAKTSLKESLNIRISLYGNKHHEVAKVLCSLGIVAYLEGNYVEALDYHKKGLEIRINTHGESHSEVARSHQHIAMVYSELKNYQDALKNYKKSLEIYEANKIKTVDVANNCKSLGELYFTQKKYHEAMGYYIKGFELFSNLRRPGYLTLETFECSSQIAKLFQIQENYTETIHYLTVCLELAETEKRKKEAQEIILKMIHVYELQNDFTSVERLSSKLKQI